MRKALTYILILVSLSANAQIVNKFRDSSWFKSGVRFDSTLVFSKGAGSGKVWTSNANGTGTWQTFTASGVTQSALDDSIAAVRDIRKVDTLYKNAGSDSVVFLINGTRYSILDKDNNTSTFTFTKNATKDSIIAVHDGTRSAVKDSIADISNLATVTNLADSTSLLRGLIPDVSSYATKTALADTSTLLRGLIPNVSSYATITNLKDSTSTMRGLINAKQDVLVSGTTIKTVNSTSLLGSGNIVTPDAQTLSTTYSDSITLAISGGNSIKFSYAVDSFSITGDSAITYKGGTRRSFSIGTYTLTKTTARDSFVLNRNGVRLSAAKDSSIAVPTFSFGRNATLDSSFAIYNGTRYAAKDSVGSGGGSSGWALTGNSATDSALNFIGTTDTKPLFLKTNNATFAKVDINGKVGIGTLIPNSTLHVAGTTALNLNNVLTLSPKLSNIKYNTAFDMTDSSIYIGLNSYFNGATWTAAQAVASYIRQSPTALTFSISSGNTINGAYTNSATTKAITLFSNGNVTVGGNTDWGYRLNSNCSTNGFDGMLIQNSSSGGSNKGGIMLYNGNANLSSLIYKAGASFTTVADRNTVFIESGEANGIAVSATNASGYIKFLQNSTERMRIDAVGSVGIGTSTPNASAILDVSSTTKGLAIPTMTSTQASAIASPKKSLMVYVTDTNGTFTSAGWWGYNGTIWKLILAE